MSLGQRYGGGLFVGGRFAFVDGFRVLGLLLGKIWEHFSCVCLTPMTIYKKAFVFGWAWGEGVFAATELSLVL